MRIQLIEIREKEKHFELSCGWEWFRSGDISSIGTEATPLKSNVVY